MKWIVDVEVCLMADRVQTPIMTSSGRAVRLSLALRPSGFKEGPDSYARRLVCLLTDHFSDKIPIELSSGHEFHQVARRQIRLAFRENRIVPRIVERNYHFRISWRWGAEFKNISHRRGSKFLTQRLVLLGDRDYGTLELKMGSWEWDDPRKVSPEGSSNTWKTAQEAMDEISFFLERPSPAVFGPHSDMS